MNTFLKVTAAAFIGSMMLSAPTSAALVSVSGTCGSVSGPTELIPAPPSFGCSRFDSNLGSLTSMSLTITGQISGSITLSNGGGAAATFAGTTQSQFYVAALSGFTLSSPLFTATMGTGPQTIGATSSTVFSGLTGGANSGAMINNTVFIPYQAPGGVGTFDINVSTLTGLLISGGGGQAGGSQSTTASATAAVRYTYDDGAVTTPEPATMALLGAGMLALGVARRRRRA